MGNDSNDEELSDLTLNALYSLTSSTLSNESIGIAINTIKEVILRLIYFLSLNDWV